MMHSNFRMVIFVVLLFCLISGCARMKPHDLERNSANKIDMILVAGATGRTGRLIVRQLLDAGYPVRAFVRNRDKAKKLFGDTVDISLGNVKDKASIQTAMNGVDRVISAIGAGPSADRTNLPEHVDYQGNKNLVEAAANNNVSHFVMVSSRNTGMKKHFLNERFHNVLIWKQKGEDSLRQSGIPYTIIRPGGLRDEDGGQVPIGAFPVKTASQLRLIPRADVAAVCVAALDTPSSRRKTLVVLSDPSADRLSWRAFFESVSADR